MKAINAFPVNTREGFAPGQEDGSATEHGTVEQSSPTANILAQKTFIVKSRRQRSLASRRFNNRSVQRTATLNPALCWSFNRIADLSNQLAKEPTGPHTHQLAYKLKGQALSVLIMVGFARPFAVEVDGAICLEIGLKTGAWVHIYPSQLSQQARLVVSRIKGKLPIVNSGRTVRSGDREGK